MENSQPKKQKNNSKKGTHKTFRLSSETSKKLVRLQQLVNKKQFGKKVQPDAILSLALDQLGDNHLENLQEKSLSNSDRIEMAFRDYLKKHPSTSKDTFLGIVARGEIQIFSIEKSTALGSMEQNLET